MTVELRDLAFLLMHFEPPPLPRRISTHDTEGGQYLAFSLRYILEQFEKARWLDCEVNAYRYLGKKYNAIPAGGNNSSNGHDRYHNPFDLDYNRKLTREDVARQIHQRACSELAPTVIDIDIDRKQFSSDRTHKNAVNRTIKKIYEEFLIPEGSTPFTNIWSGGGNHLLIPLEIDPTKYPLENKMTIDQTVPGRDITLASLFTHEHDYRFSANHRLPANQLLRFAERYLSNGVSDGGHNLSVKSDMIRVPGSYNSKYLDDVKKAEVLYEQQKWDGQTKCHIIHLLGRFYRDVQDSLQQQARKRVKARKIRYRAEIAPRLAIDNTLRKIPVSGAIASNVFGEGAYTEYAHNKYWYIDRLLQIAIDDYRKRSIDLLLAPYLITVKRMSDLVAERIIMNWALRCDALATLDFEPVDRIRSKIYDTRFALQTITTTTSGGGSSGFLPISEDKLKAEQPDWYAKITGVNIPPPPPPSSSRIGGN